MISILQHVDIKMKLKLKVALLLDPRWRRTSVKWKGFNIMSLQREREEVLMNHTATFTLHSEASKGLRSDVFHRSVTKPNLTFSFQIRATCIYGHRSDSYPIAGCSTVVRTLRSELMWFFFNFSAHITCRHHSVLSQHLTSW